MLRCASFVVVVVSVCSFSFGASAQTAFLDEERKNAMATAITSADPLLASGGVSRALGLFDHEEDPAPRVAFLNDVVARAKSPLASAIARRQRAVDQVNAGNFDDGERDFDALGHPKALLCVGPFSNTGGGALGSPTSADDVRATLEQSVAGLDRPVRWRAVPRDVRGGFDVGSRFVARREVRALCAVMLDVKSAQPAALRFGSAGQLRALVNDVEVLREDVDRPLGFDQSAAVVSLAPGKNLIVVELGILSRSGALNLRVTQPDGQPLNKAAWSTDLKNLPAKTKTATTTTTAKPPALVFAAPAAEGDLAHLRASAAVAQRTRAFDHRARPTSLQQILAVLIEKAESKAEKSSAEVRLGTEIAERDKTAARGWFQAAAAEDPTSASALSSLAELRASLGDDTEASRLHAEAIAMAPRSVIFRADRFEHERRRGALGPIIDAEILQAASTTSSARLLRIAADVLDDRGDHAGAVALLERGHDVGVIAVARGELLGARMGDPTTSTAARAELLRSLQLRMRLAPSVHTLAERVLLHLKDSGSAPEVKAFVDERRALYPDRPEPLALAARAALIDGDRVAARALLKEAQERAPEDGDLQRMARAIAADADDDALVRWLPVFDVKAARGELPPGAKELGAHVHSRTVATRFFDNGQVRSLEDVVVVVHDAKRAAGFRTFSFSYSGGREQVEVLVAERVTRDGRVEPAARIVDQGQDGKANGMYSDARSKTAVFSGVDNGDVLHLRVRKEATGLQNLFGDFFGDLEPFQGRYPQKQFRSVVEAPLSRPLYWGGRGAPEPKITEEQGTRIYDFTANDVAGVDGEAGMPPWLEIGRYLSLSTYKTWGDLGVWYEDLVRDQLRLDDDLKRVAKELKAASKSQPDLVRRTYEYVVTQTRYVGIELGIHGWKPYPVSEVHRRRFGDCKDKASLLVALLREEGIEAHLALVRTMQLGNEGTTPPSMWAFNHAIAYVPSLELFLDGTAEHSGWHELPTSDQGALSLIVDGKNSRLVTIPIGPADNNLNTSEYVLTLQPDGALVVDGTERFQGNHNADQRRTFADPATRKETLERQLSSYIAGAAVAAIDVGSLGLDEEETHYRFQATLPKRAGVESDGTLVMPLSLYPHDLAGNYAEQSTRRYPLFFDHPWRTRNVMRYVLPRGYELAELPTGGTVHGDQVRFTQTITRTKDGFVVDEDTAIIVRRVALEDYARFRKDALAADKLMKRTLRIVKKGGA
ncbi:MAG: DUF3857 and transglutaminase domain-containing protein [Deltaproteobacteria bacterium]|nr:DUF3857 and transglutaminase domain-containing protein [Deltaproteobacteria bacterium]